jgi:glycine/D-amino acid oxidase-like deaminating enzyme
MTEQQFSMPEKDTKRSLVFLWRKGFDYYIHRPATKTREPAIILGGALSQSGDDGLDEFGVSSDADKGLFIAAYLRGLLPTMFNPCRDSKFISSWTGIMGWSADLIPWVGPLPESLTRRNPARVVSSSAVNLDSWGELPGEEWICAGYSGEGMTHAWGCGKALALMILGEDVGLEEWFPKEYRVTEERAKEADVRKLKELY